MMNIMMKDFKDSTEISNLINTVKDLIYRSNPKTSTTFSFITKLLLTKVLDEIENPKNPKFKVYNSVEKTIVNINTLYHEALERLIGIDGTKAEDDDIRILSHASDGQTAKISDEAFIEIVKLFSKYRFRPDNFYKTDIIGEFFERFLTTEYKQEKGQFFTHHIVVNFIIDALEIPDKTELAVINHKPIKILDPSCGSGSFLIEILTDVDSRLGPFKYSNKDHWAKYSLYGMDIEQDLVLAAKLNMILHGDGSTNIKQGDLFSDIKQLPFFDEEFVNLELDSDQITSKKSLEMFDYIVSNPPFSVPIINELSIDTLNENFIVHSNYADSFKKNSEPYVLERYYQLLKEHGKLGIILPDSVFDSLNMFELRKFLLTRFKINAIISLPETVFAPFALQRTSILLAEKREYLEAKELTSIMNNKGLKEVLDKLKNEKIYFANVEKVGYVRTKKSYTQISNDLELILENMFQNWNEFPKFGKFKKISDLIITKDFRLDPKFHLNVLSEGILFSDLVQPVKIDRVNEKDLPEIIRYVETGDINTDNSFSVSILTIPYDDDVRLIKKIKSGKIFKPKKGQILISPVRPYQGKILLVETVPEDLFFSTDFIVLQAKPNIDPLIVFLILKNSLEQINSISRIGKSGYPKLRVSDLMLMRIDQNMLNSVSQKRNLYMEYKKLIVARDKLAVRISELQRILFSIH